MKLLNKKCPVCGKEYDKAISLRMHVLGKNTKDKKHRAFAKRYRIWLNGNMIVKCPVCLKNKRINRKRMLLGKSDGICSRKCAGRLGGRGNARDTVAELNANATIRPCLKCKKLFKSVGIHNRLCERCKATNKRIARNIVTEGGLANVNSGHSNFVV